MEITLEQVERLREKAGVSYAQAKQALERSGGNLLDALIDLEETGAIPRQADRRCTTASQRGHSAVREDVPPSAAQTADEEERARPQAGFFRRLRYLLVDNELEIWRKDLPFTSIPVLILILLFFVAPWITLPLLILGLFFGFRYRLVGPDLERESINSVMEDVADTADRLGRHVAEELRSQRDKFKGGDGQR